MGSYSYDSVYLWPSIVSTVLLAILGLYGWRHRHVPGALSFAVCCLFAVLWSIGSMLETAALDPGTKIAWARFVTMWQLPVVTAAACFVLQYAGLGRWLTRRALLLLALPPLLYGAVVATDGLHHLVWSGFELTEGGVLGIRAPLLFVALGYSYVLFVLNIGVLLWFANRSPGHRAPIALMLAGQVGARIVFEIATRVGFPSHWDPDPFVLLVMSGLYAVALFGFHVLDPLPVARAAALRQMRDGMLVLDARGSIVDVNRAAERALGAPAADLRFRPVEEVLPRGALPDAADGSAMVHAEFDLVCGGASARRHAVEVTALHDRRDYPLGRLLLLHDITEERQAQARLLEQERVVAILQERERLARELHDGVGQVFGYLSLQGQTVAKLLRDGNGEEADALLSRLTDVAQHAHADVRESILALKAGSSEDWSFLPTLERYLTDFHEQYGMGTELVVADGVKEESFPPGIGVQLLRVIQEAMTNARRHAGDCTICVSIGREDSQARITVTDDGCGFDPGELEADSGKHFGLSFMRERMAQIAGSVRVDSHPGAGTSVNLQAPLRGEQVKG